MKKKMVVAVVIVVLALAIAGIAYAFTLGNVDGKWGYIENITETSSTSSNGGGAECSRWATGAGDSPTNSSNWDVTVQTGLTTDENQVRYGRDAYMDHGQWHSRSCANTVFGEQSGFGFDGNNGPLSPSANTPFYLGKFIHYNNQVYATDDSGNNSNPFNWVDLNVSVPVTCNDGTTSTSFNFSSHFVLDETSNTAGTCVYPGTSVCPDKVTVTQPTTSPTFTCPDGDYTVNILGFTKTGLNGGACDATYNSASVATEYITEEDVDNQACLWAEISAPTADLKPVKTCADYNTSDPYYRIVTTNLGPGSARQAKISDTLPSGVVLGTPLVYSSQLTTSSGTVNQGSCSTSGQTVTCQLLTSLLATSVDATAKWTVDIHVTPNDSITYPLSNSVTASMATTDVNTANNTSTCSSETPTAVEVSAFSALGVEKTIAVSWETSSEVNILSFNLYRGSAPVGERVYYEEAKFKGKLAGAEYTYTDTDVQTGMSYTYWLEVLLKDGTSVVLDPTTASIQAPGDFKVYLPILRR